MGRITAKKQWKSLRRVGALAIVFGIGASAAPAAVTRFETIAQQQRVGVGERIVITIRIETNDRMPNVEPSEPDFGGLRLTGRPSTRRNTQMTNFSRPSYTLDVTYTLTASAPGEYVIGPSEVQIDGRTYTTRPVTITATEVNLDHFPAVLRDEPILNPITIPSNREIESQLKGLVFVRPVVSKLNPYVGEPFIISYKFYFDPRLSPGSLGQSEPQFDQMMSDVLLEQGTQVHEETIEGRKYHVALLYRAILTPARDGEFALDGFKVQFRLPVQSGGRRSRRGRFGSSDLFFDDFFNSIFDRSTVVEAAAGQVVVNVRPLPLAGQPAAFTGTVGDFTLDSKLDQDSITTDDALTLTLTIEGKGNVQLASIPEFPESEDLELFSATPTVTWPIGEEMTGKKEIEYILRPKRAGEFMLPAIDYVIFDPEAEEYRHLASKPVPIRVTHGTSTGRALSEPGERAGEDEEEQLRHIKPIWGIKTAAPKPLTENIFYWGLQACALGAAGVSLVRKRRRESAAPAGGRKGRAWTALEKKIKAVRDAASSGDADSAALALERALREFIADWYDLSADGITSEEISRLLVDAGMSADRVARFTEILGSCANVRYAPIEGAGNPFADWSEEARTILAETLK